jgi:hypothetical protein
VRLHRRVDVGEQRQVRRDGIALQVLRLVEDDDPREVHGGKLGERDDRPVVPMLGERPEETLERLDLPGLDLIDHRQRFLMGHRSSPPCRPRGLALRPHRERVHSGREQARFRPTRRRRPGAPVLVVLTGTCLQPDAGLAASPGAQRTGHRLPGGGVQILWNERRIARFRDAAHQTVHPALWTVQATSDAGRGARSTGGAAARRVRASAGGAAYSPQHPGPLGPQDGGGVAAC